MQIEGRSALVTGGASGPGAATAAMLARGGANVTVFDLDEALGRETAATIGGGFLKVDIADDAGVAVAGAAEGIHAFPEGCRAVFR